ncbi:TldD/PmbA family protein [Proteiniborus sp. MB09-C3]|uniref:TldD/PmbA family protein n=1 Tax=Proteiniborus sp. MB09-C3 TaxID=3050072 RepID=UPI0025571121|nr:TldD/PmbA family protein [Proteiniborus sp. MB09-C3]WIV11482.1 TldD/PmbA family protein [Proteiniborus sp. MB09-C3]
MANRELIEKIFNKGKELGLGDMEVYIQGNKQFDTRIFEGEIDKYSISDEVGLSFRGVYNGKMGYSYTEKVDESSIDMLIKEAMGNAVTVDSDDEEEIFAGSKEYKEVNTYNSELENVTSEQKIEFAKALEKAAYEADKRVTSVNYCLYDESTSYSVLANTKGLNLENKSNIAETYVSVVVKDGDDIKTGEKYIISNDFSKFNAEELAKGAVDEAISMLKAESIESGEYPIILRNDVAASVLQAFSSVFIAENVQKDLSLLKGKLNEQIAKELITIVDDPFLKDGVVSASFDGEGVATKYKKVIDKGVLKTYLHNSKTAKKDGVESTGNASKGSYKSPVSISPTNMYIENGSTSVDDMIESTEKGIMIIDVQGLHSGLNAVSGDFSLSAYGYLIEKGKISRPVNQITIAGNLYEVLKNIDSVGNDLKFGFPGFGYIGSPSLKINSLAVAGK